MIEIVQADLTTLAVDAIVNAANPTLLGGGGVDGAIHHAAGPQLLVACRAIPEVAPGVRCPTGEARLTRGYALPARWVIHCVGPIWRGGQQGEPALLAACYRNALQLTHAHHCASIAFPAISCGVYGYPLGAAATIALHECRRWLDRSLPPQRIVLCCFNASTAAACHAALDGPRDG